ncbi:MAG: hypothetical protein FJW31_02290 [Acidobacteria bacterium]|nr:hypothetical protein [Acidobacteriota bacterium]
MEPWEWPKGAGPVVADALVDKATPTEDHIAAAQMAGDMVLMNDGVAALLLKLLEDAVESTELRTRAAIALGPALDEASLSDFDDVDLEPSISKGMFHRIGLTLIKICNNAGEIKELRRRALEAAVRAPEDWHREAIRTAYASGDAEWKLTAVFGMKYIRGFEKEILETLNTSDPELLETAVTAAGNGELQSAWPRIKRILKSPATEKSLLLAAIEASACVNPAEARTFLEDFEESDDEEISATATEALTLMRAEDEDLEEDSRDWLN